jgi:hypothetical protein
MPFESLVTGAVFIYPFLWKRQADAGETEGRKDRPVAVALRVGRVDGSESIVVLPITTKAPHSGQLTAEIPHIEKRRAGLDPDRRLWIVMDEANLDVLGNSYYMGDPAPIGTFSRSFFVPIARQFIAHFKAAAKIDRTR